MSDWIRDSFGSKRGFALTYWYSLNYAVGRYQQFRRHIDWQNIERLVFICTGNICRSAFAQAVSLAQGVESISCGLRAIFDQPANEYAIKVAKNAGYDLTNHKTTPIMYPVFRKTDLLISMEPWQAIFWQKNAPRNYQQTLLGLWGSPVRPYIHDPFNTSMEYFEECFNYIENSVNAIVSNIKKNN